MPLIDRVKSRVETDLSDLELQTMVDEALEAIVDRWGPAADALNPVTELLEGGGLWLFPRRLVDLDETVTVVETSGSIDTTLATDDFEIWDGGRTLRRLSDGTNSRSRWAPRVKVTYVPAATTLRREETVIKLVQLNIQYRGLTRESVGDTTDEHVDYREERERILSGLAPSAFGIR